MSEHDPRERAFSRTREAAERERWTAAVLARRRGRPLEPGDLCVLPSTEAYPVEWALIERGLEDPRRILAMPADTFPPAGTGDVEVPASETAGPLRLRCRFALWVEEGTFADARRTGVLAPRWRREAGEVHEALAAGNLPVSSLAEETDAESEYRDWQRDVLAPARAALERAAAAAPRRKAAVPGFAFAPQLAAAFLLAAVGLGIWAAQLRGRADDPGFGGETALVNPQRGSGFPVRVPPGATIVPMQLELTQPGAGRRLEIVDDSGKRVWVSREEIPAETRDVTIIVPRRKLLDGSYRIQLTAGNGTIEETWRIDVREIEHP